MSHDASVLSGSPASGKDAITEALSQSSPRYVHFEKFKAGAGRQAGSRLTTTADIDRMRGLGLILHANERYGNPYAVDRPSLDALFAQDLVPILHMGHVLGVVPEGGGGEANTRAGRPRPCRPAGRLGRDGPGIGASGPW